MISIEVVHRPVIASRSQSYKSNFVLKRLHFLLNISWVEVNQQVILSYWTIIFLSEKQFSMLTNLLQSDLKIIIFICTNLFSVTRNFFLSFSVSLSLSFFPGPFLSFHSYLFLFDFFPFFLFLFSLFLCSLWKIILLSGLSTLCAWLFTFLFHLLSATSYLRIIVRHIRIHAFPSTQSLQNIFWRKKEVFLFLSKNYLANFFPFTIIQWMTKSNHTWLHFCLFIANKAEFPGTVSKWFFFTLQHIFKVFTTVSAY